MTYRELLNLLLRGSYGFLNPQSLAVGGLMSMAGPWGLPVALAGAVLGDGGEKRYFSVNIAVSPKISDVLYVAEPISNPDSPYYGFDPGWVYMKMKAPYDPALDHGESRDSAVTEYILRYNPQNHEVQYLSGQNPETGQSVWQPVGSFMTASQSGTLPIDDDLATIIIPDNLYYSIHDALQENDLEELWGSETVPEPIEYDIVGEPVVYNGHVTASFDIETGSMVDGIVPVSSGSQATATPQTQGSAGGGRQPMGKETYFMTTSTATSVPQWAEDLWNEFMRLVTGIDMGQSWSETLVQTQQALQSFYESIAKQYGETIETVGNTLEKMTSQPTVNINFGDTPIGEWVPYSKSIPAYSSLIGNLLNQQASLGAPYAALASLPQTSLMAVLQPMLSQWNKSGEMYGYGTQPKPSTSLLQGATGIVNLISGLGNAADAIGKIGDLFKTTGTPSTTLSTTPSTGANVTESATRAMADYLSNYLAMPSWETLFTW